METENTLVAAGFAVSAVAPCEEALKIAASGHPVLAVMDIRLAGRMDGIETAVELFRNLRPPLGFCDRAFRSGYPQPGRGSGAPRLAGEALCVNVTAYSGSQRTSTVPGCAGVSDHRRARLGLPPLIQSIPWLIVALRAASTSWTSVTRSVDRLATAPRTDVDSRQSAIWADARCHSLQVSDAHAPIQWLVAAGQTP
ncbi:hypothetical protein [Mesorhizobium sp. B2-7-1]|uniref:hypothetical protein n=1 Tax=Mesorhizobium sp. B2-7-1 TaxID=2589909 RepID=UPI001FED4B5D|nr:hypothetical protein [Mesorhizobium sp. B2-7-1]